MVLFHIAKREWKALILSPMFFVIIGFCSLIWSYTYIRALISFAAKSMGSMNIGGGPMLNIHYAVFVPHISYVNLICIFAIPALTMKLIAEEKRRGTIGLLLTSPISSVDITLGKFLGGLGAAYTLVIVSSIYPILSMLIGDFSVGPLLSSYLGLFLIVGIYVAVGLFCSAVTGSPVLAVILGVLFNIFYWFLGQEVQFVEHGWPAQFFEQISIGHHFMEYLKGNITIRSTVYIVSAISLVVFFTQRVIESVRWR